MEKETTITTKKGLEKEWKILVNKNKNKYGREVILITAKVCKLLDEGKSPEEAEKEVIKDSGITGFMYGAMAGIINHFHPRGYEFNKYWDKHNI